MTDKFTIWKFFSVAFLRAGLSQWLSGKESACNAGDTGEMGLISGSGRSPGGGHGNMLQYSCLEHAMDRGEWQATVHRVAKNHPRLKWLSSKALRTRATQNFSGSSEELSRRGKDIQLSRTSTHMYELSEICQLISYLPRRVDGMALLSRAAHTGWESMKHWLLSRSDPVTSREIRDRESI